ncbi:photosystem II biogenesis protein Psp29 [Cyanobacterium aponinum FACHB-4101]|nr:photosystem II biogenesis protein Psp29 [Cyanobacterium aponinum]MBD2393479.1 photosystem II biogenesis protein Psp29 [Cyanobacterium aponinum FACHB-4101]
MLTKLLSNILFFVDKNRTVSDTKRSFYQHHQRPINSIYRRVVEELMVEMHLLAVNVDFNPDPIYYLGVYQSFQQFMRGYKPESDKESIFNALCQSIENNPQEYISKSQTLLNFAEGKSAQEILDWLLNPSGEGDLEVVASHWRSNLENPRFKYSRLFAIGVYTLMEKSDGEFVKDENKFTDFIKPLIDKLQLPVEKLKKDLDLYSSNLEKMNQMLSVMADVLEAERKKKQAESK